MAEAALASGKPSQTDSAESASVDSSSLKPTQDLNSRISAAKTPSDVRAIIEENRQAMEAAVNRAKRGEPQPEAKKEVEATPDNTIPPDLKAAAEAEAQAEGEEVAPEAESVEAPDSDAGETDDDPADDIDGGDGPVSPVTGKRAHLRLAADDKVGRLAASYMKRNRDLPMAEAIARAQAQLGIKPQGAEPETKSEAAPDSGLPKTVEAVDAAIKSLRAERKKANAELNFEAASEISDKLEDLIHHRLNIERQAERQQVEQAATYDRQFSASEAKATEMYPLAGDPNSAFGKRMIEIESELKANGDPLYESPMKPLRIAQMVAAELSIAPKKKGAPAAPVKAAAPVQPPAKKQVLPTGGSRTAAPIVNQKPAIDAEIESVKSVQDLRNLRKKLGLSN